MNPYDLAGELAGALFDVGTPDEGVARVARVVARGPYDLETRWDQDVLVRRLIEGGADPEDVALLVRASERRGRCDAVDVLLDEAPERGPRWVVCATGEDGTVGPPLTAFASRWEGELDQWMVYPDL